MAQRWRQWWPVLKAVLALTVLAAVGWQFVRILQTPALQDVERSRSSADVLWERMEQARPGWLVLAGVLYLLGLGCSAVFWRQLLRRLGQRLPAWATARAYYVSQLGKYLPGKAWAVLLRVTLARGPGVRLGVAGLTAFYEVLTTMASGALLAAVLFALLMPDTAVALDWTMLRSLFFLQAEGTDLPDRRVLVLLALALFAPFSMAILPAIFNRAVHHLSWPFRQAEAEPLPAVRTRSVGDGLLLTGVCWPLLGASLWAVLRAVMREPPEWSLGLWGRCTAFLAVSYVAGFLIFVVPASLGTREYFLTLFLVPELSGLGGRDDGEIRAVVIAAVVILRLVWTLADVLAAGLLWWLPARDKG
jgi:uncharacterized membrane protein YbhN (UPF0104 family)